MPYEAHNPGYWQIGLAEFVAADRDYTRPVPPDLARVLLPLIGCRLDAEEQAEVGVYLATLTPELEQALLREGHIEVEFRSRDGMFRLQCEVDLDHIEDRDRLLEG